MELEVKGLSFSYGAHRVFEDVSFEARSGQTVCLLGHNGVGKSTLFRCLLGLAEGYGGEIRVDGDEIRTMSRREFARRVAYIPQSTDPAFDYSVVDVVLMGRTAHGRGFAGTTPADEEAAFEALDRVGIASLADCGFARISGGERQMVLIARALAQKTGMLVMDEPTANLDFGNQYRTMRLIEDLRASGYLVVMSTHNPQQALAWATSVLVLHGGRLFAQGAPEAVLTRETMERIYGIPVHVLDAVDENGRTRRVCVPGD